ncbi:hypothetical protein DAEQUDRAFT_726719 [Daedalea quercina L-15889]|uniref:Uncharacterized protein n=1 Tax=Daedalea quercina L-15889 TaxID=1314783 RepID=A0A165QFX9_9APHY|nr:hypothetical protein DAEQUDRAFT_726719 [Daedalea quercina L-15889]
MQLKQLGLLFLALFVTIVFGAPSTHRLDIIYDISELDEDELMATCDVDYSS